MNYPVIDLFSGAGGLGLGVTAAGGDLRLSVELNELACMTMKSNPKYHKGKVVCADVRNLTGEMLKEEAGLKSYEKFFIVGGPPCQPFSKASYWTDPGNESKYRRAKSLGEVLEKPEAITEAKEDERRSLIFEFYRLIKESDPEGFLFENVPSILHPRNKKLFENFRNSMHELGYLTTFVKVNGLNHGIAQKRLRVILLGLKERKPSSPEITHTDDPQLLDKGYLPIVTPSEVLSSFRSNNFFEEEEVIKGKWASQFMEIPPGMNYKALTAWAGHPNPSFIAETRFWNFLLKLHPYKPSWTIAASPGPWTGPFHWDNRRLRIPELAVLQGFPGDYKFCGSRREQVKQIGNAFPCHIAKACMNSLFGKNSKLNPELLYEVG